MSSKFGEMGTGTKLFIVFVIVMIIASGVGGYFLYEWYKKKYPSGKTVSKFEN